MINLTPHAIVIRLGGETDPVITIPPSGIVARCATEDKAVLSLRCESAFIPAIVRNWGDIECAPDPDWTPVPGETYIVSSVVLEAAGRQGKRSNLDPSTLCAPDTGATCIRDEQGRIVAVTQLVVL
jgi:hypothetical protein